MTPGKAQATEPIDAVYTWAKSDGSALRYALRSLDRYAPWVRKVYVVTDGHVPTWLQASQPKLGVVRHEDIFRDRTALPTANREAIAWQLFRIPGLSRQFLWLDPDFVFGRPLRPTDFLTAKGGYRFYVEDAEVPVGGTAPKLLNSRFGERTGRKLPARAPRMLDRNFLEEVNRLWEKQIKQTVAHTGPQPDDVAMEALYFYYLLECPQQYGIHELARLTPEILRSVPLADTGQIMSLLFSRPPVFRLEGGGEPGALAKLLLKLLYWRRSPLEGS